MEDEDKLNKLNMLTERRKKLSMEFNVLMRAFTSRHSVISQMVSRKCKRAALGAPMSAWDVAYKRARDRDSVIKNLTVRLTKCQVDIAKIDRMIQSIQKNKQRDAQNASPTIRWVNQENGDKNEK